MIDLAAGSGQEADGLPPNAFPWERSPYRLWSLWEIMEKFRAESFYSIASVLRMLVEASETGKDAGWHKKIVGVPKEKLCATRERLVEIGAELSVVLLDRILTNLEILSRQEFFEEIKDLDGRIRDELSLMHFLHIPSARLVFYAPKDPPFGSEVEANFSSANEDIYEGLKCLALGRSTACVMHLMRVVEVGLKALAKELGINEKNDWGAYITSIDTELQKRYKQSGARSLDERFFAEVSIRFDQIRRAWRNPTMHVESTYTEERGEQIMQAVKSFMTHLATRLHE